MVLFVRVSLLSATIGATHSVSPFSAMGSNSAGSRDIISLVRGPRSYLGDLVGPLTDPLVLGLQGAITYELPDTGVKH